MYGCYLLKYLFISLKGITPGLLPGHILLNSDSIQRYLILRPIVGMGHIQTYFHFITRLIGRP